MLYRIGEVDRRPGKSGHPHGLLQQFPGWTHKGSPLQVFLITRLLTHEHDLRVRRALTKDCLRGEFVEGTLLAPFRLAPFAL